MMSAALRRQEAEALLRECSDAARADDTAILPFGIEAMDGPPVLLGQPERIAARLRPYVDLGFRTFIVRLPAPYDTETLARV